MFGVDHISAVSAKLIVLAGSANLMLAQFKADYEQINQLSELGLPGVTLLIIAALAWWVVKKDKETTKWQVENTEKLIKLIEETTQVVASNSEVIRQCQHIIEDSE